MEYYNDTIVSSAANSEVSNEENKKAIVEKGRSILIMLKTLSLISFIIFGIYLLILVIGCIYVLIEMSNSYSHPDFSDIAGIFIALPICALYTYIPFIAWKGIKKLLFAIQQEKGDTFLNGLNDIHIAVRISWWIVMICLAFGCVALFFGLLGLLLK